MVPLRSKKCSSTIFPRGTIEAFLLYLKKLFFNGRSSIGPCISQADRFNDRSCCLKLIHIPLLILVFVCYDNVRISQFNDKKVLEAHKTRPPSRGGLFTIMRKSTIFDSHSPYPRKLSINVLCMSKQLRW